MVTKEKEKKSSFIKFTLLDKCGNLHDLDQLFNTKRELLVWINKQNGKQLKFIHANDVSELIIHSKLQLSQTKEQKNFASVSLKATRY